MSNTYVIRSEGLSKLYRIGRRESYRMLRDTFVDAATATWDAIQSFVRGSDDEENGTASRPRIWALKDIDFEIQPGDSVGIVGSNGAGKTTLLKILARVTVPTKGRVHLRGRVGSLLEVGTGFHPELTGRENIYLNGAVLGMKKLEIDRKFDEIVAFSEVEKFLDTAVKFYSAGMRVRLAFSVAAHLEPEILLIDEVLAVGDVAFQKKSLGKMEDVTQQGRTVLFVSHNMAAVKSLCQTGIYLEHGQLRYFGDVGKAIETYLNSGELQQQPQIRLQPDLTLVVQIMEVFVSDSEGRTGSHFPHDQPIDVTIKVAVRQSAYLVNISLNVLDSDLNIILSTFDFEQDENQLQARQPGLYTYHLRLPPILVPDDYRLSIRAVRVSRTKEKMLHSVENICPFNVFDNGSARSRANTRWTGKVSMPIRWDYKRVPLDPMDGSVA